MKATPQHFWKRVQRTTPDACWEWSGATNSTGYGTLSYQGRAATAHRTAAFLSGLVQDIASPKDRKGGGFVLHACDNRLCCNPAHMRVGSYRDNQLDAYTRQRRQAYKGAAHTNAKHTEEGVRLIKDLYANGVSQQAIADLLAVSQSCISKILRGESYV